MLGNKWYERSMPVLVKMPVPQNSTCARSLHVLHVPHAASAHCCLWHGMHGGAVHAAKERVGIVPFPTPSLLAAPPRMHRQRALLLAACTAVLYTPQNEHFGIVPLEAMAAGRPVVACNSGGPLESVLHLTTGMLCAPEPGEQ